MISKISPLVSEIEPAGCEAVPLTPAGVRHGDASDSISGGTFDNRVSAAVWL